MLPCALQLGIGSHPGGTDFLPTSRGFDHYFGVPHGLGACPCHACFAPNTSCAIGCSPEWAPCPVFANSTIVQQPAELLTLSASYGAAAVDFMTAAARRQQPWFLWYPLRINTCETYYIHGYLLTNSTYEYGGQVLIAPRALAAVCWGVVHQCDQSRAFW